MTEMEARAIIRLGEKNTVCELVRLSGIIDVLAARLAALEARLAKDSHNSSKPPSSDGLAKPAPKSLRKKSGKKPGGQKGHPGSTRQLVDTPDHVIVHPVDECHACGCDLHRKNADSMERRQVWEIPPIVVEVTEHQFLSKTCHQCGAVTTSAAMAPADVQAPVQFGRRLQAVAVYLKEYQLLPYERSAEVFADLFDCQVSPGTLASMVRGFTDHLDKPLAAIKKILIASKVIHCDESGMSIMGKRHWVHVVATPKVTLYMAHSKRGFAAATDMGILGEFHGRMIHDFWTPYYLWKCAHALCNAHHLRELIFVLEIFGQGWAQLMIDFLLDAKAKVDKAKQDGGTSLSAYIITKLDAQFIEIIAMGEVDNPQPLQVPGRKGRPADTKAGNLVRRLKDHQSEALAFIYDFNVVFDNNLAERDIRMIKLRQKISGTFRSLGGAHAFCKTRSYISTARKHGLKAFDAILMALNGNPFVPKPSKA